MSLILNHLHVLVFLSNATCPELLSKFSIIDVWASGEIVSLAKTVLIDSSVLSANSKLESSLVCRTVTITDIMFFWSILPTYYLENI